MQLMVPLLQDTDKLKDWLSRKCTSEVVTGDELSAHWGRMATGSTDVPASLLVCKSTDDTLAQLSTCGLALDN